MSLAADASGEKGPQVEKNLSLVLKKEEPEKIMKDEEKLAEGPASLRPRQTLDAEVFQV